ncbi:MAG: antibiotic biosynthesis monooxygenase [Desulfobacteraceae bacterium]|nr:antibiotic biosynthesis monooxygenase [Desulfobacteraceae bacterium]
MFAKIIIKRHFKTGNTEQIKALLNELRSHAMQQPGYISAETLVKKDCFDCMTIIATWQNIKSWYHWKNHPVRMKFEAMLDLYQIEPTQYEEYLLGSPLKNYL